MNCVNNLQHNNNRLQRMPPPCAAERQEERRRMGGEATPPLLFLWPPMPRRLRQAVASTKRAERRRAESATGAWDAVERRLDWVGVRGGACSAGSRPLRDHGCRTAGRGKSVSTNALCRCILQGMPGNQCASRLAWRKLTVQGRSAAACCLAHLTRPPTAGVLDGARCTPSWAPVTA